MSHITPARIYHLCVVTEQAGVSFFLHLLTCWEQEPFPVGVTGSVMGSLCSGGERLGLSKQRREGRETRGCTLPTLENQFSLFFCLTNA